MGRDPPGPRGYGQARPGVKIEWIKGHGGATWNEYADRLATAWEYDNK